MCKLTSSCTAPHRVAGNFLVGFRVYDLLDFLVNEVVERVDVLPHQPAHRDAVVQVDKLKAKA
jgi:hypothetical protein